MSMHNVRLGSVHFFSNTCKRSGEESRYSVIETPCRLAHQERRFVVRKYEGSRRIAKYVVALTASSRITCGCMAGRNGRPCKHQGMVLREIASGVALPGAALTVVAA